MPEDVDLKGLAGSSQRNIYDRAALHDPRVENKHIWVVLARVSDVDLVQQIELDRLEFDPAAAASARTLRTCGQVSAAAMTMWPARASSIAEPRPKPELAPVIRTFFGMSFLSEMLVCSLERALQTNHCQ